MKAFTEAEHCPKCDYLPKSVEYHRGLPPGIAVNGCGWPEEHLHVTCVRCQYGWRRAPKRAG